MRSIEHSMSGILLGLAGLLAIGLPSSSIAEEIRVAVASNFAITAEAIAEGFTARSGTRVVLAKGSTGKLYAQIIHGAPFDVFLAADEERPRRLEQEGYGSRRFSYAIGRLVLWRGSDGEPVAGPGLLRTGRFSHLALANPDLAPFGRAAREVLESLGRWEALRPRMAMGESVGQAFQFIAAGGADLGFVAASQLITSDRFFGVGSIWDVPTDLYQPIVQQGILLGQRPAASRFVDYLLSEDVRAMIRQQGYELP